MKLVIPMAGKGTRLRPHTLMKPKPLLKVAGKTILQHLLDKFSDLDVSEVIFIINPNQGDRIGAFMKKHYKFDVKFVEQKVADGTAGAVRLAKDFVDEDVVIIYADTLFDADLSVVKKVQKDDSVHGIIWAKEVEDYQRFGVLVLDKHDCVTKIVEKPKEPISKLANIGMYYIKDYKLMFEGIEHLYANKLTMNNEYFLVHAFQYMIDHGSKLKYAPIGGWYDCGTIPALLETNKVLLEHIHTINSQLKNSVVIPPVFIDKDVIIENSIIGPYVSIATGCVIQNSIVRNSVFDHDTKLSEVKLTDSVLGESVLLNGKCKKLNLGDHSEVHFEQ